MTEEEKYKRRVRSRVVWKKFRESHKKLSKGKDEITLSKLSKLWKLHHLDLNINNYEVFTDERFVNLNPMTHDFVHWAYKYYSKDPLFLDRLKSVLDRMVTYNN